jgi:hypothetical protein
MELVERNPESATEEGRATLTRVARAGMLQCAPFAPKAIS